MTEPTKTPAKTPKTGTDPHPGMMGDGTEEQNLGQPGNPAARITEEEVAEAFKTDKDERKAAL